ncbi:MAG: hypothetical protein ACP6IS_11820 [Candidatus Asgardarchaeia archaeon]
MFINNVFTLIVSFAGMAFYLSVESIPPPGEPAPPMYYFLYIVVPQYILIFTMIFVLPVLWSKVKKNLKKKYSLDDSDHVNILCDSYCIPVCEL